MNNNRKKQTPARDFHVGARVHCILAGGLDGVVYTVRGSSLDIAWEDGSASIDVPKCLVKSSIRWRVLVVAEPATVKLPPRALGPSKKEVADFLKLFRTQL